MEMNNKKSLIRINGESFVFGLLIAYLASTSLIYTPWLITNFDSITLNGFIILSAAVLLYRRMMILPIGIKWFGVFTLFCFISLIYSPNKNDALNVCILLLKILVFLLFFYCSVNTMFRVKAVLCTLSISTFVLFLYLFSTSQLFVVNNRLGNEIVGNANAFATLFMIGAFSSVFFILYSNRLTIRYIYTGIFICQELAIALSGGRKFFVLPLVLLFSLYIVNSNRHGKKHIIIKILLSALAIYMIYYLVFNMEVLYSAIGYRFEGIVNGALRGGTYEQSAGNRLRMISDGLAKWLESPFFGHGINSFKTITTWGIYAHNNFIELLCDLGIFGAIVYYYFYFYIFKKASLLKTNNPEKAYWVMIAVCMLLFDYGAVSYNIILIQMIIALIIISIN